jgi:hypothetical protein
LRKTSGGTESELVVAESVRRRPTSKPVFVGTIHRSKKETSPPL